MGLRLDSPILFAVVTAGCAVLISYIVTIGPHADKVLQCEGRPGSPFKVHGHLSMQLECTKGCYSDESSFESLVADRTIPSQSVCTDSCVPAGVWKEQTRRFAERTGDEMRKARNMGVTTRLSAEEKQAFHEEIQAKVEAFHKAPANNGICEDGHYSQAGVDPTADDIRFLFPMQLPDRGVPDVRCAVGSDCTDCGVRRLVLEDMTSLKAPAAIKGSSYKDFVTLDKDVELTPEDEEALRKKAPFQTMPRHEAEAHHMAAESEEGTGDGLRRGRSVDAMSVGRGVPFCLMRVHMKRAGLREYVELRMHKQQFMQNSDFTAVVGLRATMHGVDDDHSIRDTDFVKSSAQQGNAEAAMHAFGEQIGTDEVIRSPQTRVVHSWLEKEAEDKAAGVPIDEAGGFHEPEMVLTSRDAVGYSTYDIRLWTNLRLPIGGGAAQRRKRLDDVGGSFPNMTSAHLTVVGTHDHFAILEALVCLAGSATSLALWAALLVALAFAGPAKRCEEHAWLLLLLPMVAFGLNPTLTHVRRAFYLTEAPSGFEYILSYTRLASHVTLLLLQALLLRRLAAGRHAAKLGNQLLHDRSAAGILCVGTVAIGVLLALTVPAHEYARDYSQYETSSEADAAFLADQAAAADRPQFHKQLRRATLLWWWGLTLYHLARALLTLFETKAAGRTHAGWQLRFVLGTAVMSVALMHVQFRYFARQLGFGTSTGIASPNDFSVSMLVLHIVSNWYVFTLVTTFWPSRIPSVTASGGASWTSATAALMKPTADSK